MNEQLQRVMDTAYACLQACNHCYNECLKEEDIDMMRECIRLDRECADMCLMVLSYAGREGVLQHDLISLCEKICQACGNECAQHEHMEHCQECAKACFACADACREYISA